MAQTRKVIVASPSRMPIYGHRGHGISATGVPVSPPAKSIQNVNQRKPISTR